MQAADNPFQILYLTDGMGIKEVGMDLSINNRLYSHFKELGNGLYSVNKSLGSRVGSEYVDSSNSKYNLEDISRALNKHMGSLNTDISFSYNSDIHGLVVTVREADGGRIIREIPSQEAINIMKKIRDVVGNILDQRG